MVVEHMTTETGQFGYDCSGQDYIIVYYFSKIEHLKKFQPDVFRRSCVALKNAGKTGVMPLIEGTEIKL